MSSHVPAISCPAWQDAALESDDDLVITSVHLVRQPARHMVKSEGGVTVKQEGGTDRKMVSRSQPRKDESSIFAAVPDISALILACILLHFRAARGFRCILVTNVPLQR